MLLHACNLALNTFSICVSLGAFAHNKHIHTLKKKFALFFLSRLIFIIIITPPARPLVYLLRMYSYVVSMYVVLNTRYIGMNIVHTYPFSFLFKIYLIYFFFFFVKLLLLCSFILMVL